MSEQHRHVQVAREQGLGQAIVREWIRPGLNFQAKGHSFKNQTLEYTNRQRRTLGVWGETKGGGGTKNSTPPPRTGRVLGRRSRPVRGGGWFLWSQAEGGRDPWTRKTWGWQGPGNRSRKTRGGNWTGEGRHSSREEFIFSARHGREAQTNGSSRRAGAPSRWTVTPQPGKRKGGRNLCKSRENRRWRVKDRGK